MLFRGEEALLGGLGRVMRSGTGGEVQLLAGQLKRHAFLFLVNNVWTTAAADPTTLKQRSYLYPYLGR